MLTLAIQMVQMGNLRDKEFFNLPSSHWCPSHSGSLTAKPNSLPFPSQFLHRSPPISHFPESHPLLQSLLYPIWPTQHLNSRMFYILYSYAAESITHLQTWDVDSGGIVYFRLSLSSHLSWGNITSLGLVLYHDNIFLLKFLWKYKEEI